MRFILLFVMTVASFHAFAEIITVDFDQSMGIDNKARYNLLFKQGEHSETIFNFYRDLYNRNKPSKISTSKELKIPKIIHQIWIGPAPYPKLYQKYRDVCLALNPDWQYKLWTDKDVENWDFANKDLYNKSISYQERADILRYEILYKHGGLYIDTDYMCLTKLGELNYLYDFYAGAEPPAIEYDSLTVSNALIGAKPHHRIFPVLFQKIRKHWDDKKFTNLALTNPRAVPQYRTMSPLTDAIYETYSAGDATIILPSTYFMPMVGMSLKYDYLLIDQIKLFLGIYRNVNTFGSIKPESMAIQDVFDQYISPNLGNLH